MVPTLILFLQVPNHVRLLSLTKMEFPTLKSGITRLELNA